MHAADALSCATLTEKTLNTDNTGLDIETRVASVIKYTQITDEKMKEIKQKRVKNYIMHGWSDTIKGCKTETQPYFNHRTDLTT